MKLECVCDIVCEASNAPVFISARFYRSKPGRDHASGAETHPFIGFVPGKYRVELFVDLPPLVPDIYWLKFWIGTHNTRTIDNIRQAVAIEITENPSVQRSFPYPPITAQSCRRCMPS